MWRQDQATYGQIIFDFQWLRLRESFDERIHASPELLELDEDFREAHLDVLERFYKLFESMYNYIKDMVQFFQDLEDGYFMQHSLDVSLHCCVLRTVLPHIDTTDCAIPAKRAAGSLADICCGRTC